ncbi:MAG: hypothetical protein RBT80_03705 [Candidatus Vecturithrix sp.]|nr:hypothetical protein [Candidatus Vecturithrix sp.]
MATSVIQGINTQIVAEYERASEEERLQVNKAIEDIFALWAHRQMVVLKKENLWRKMEDFIRHAPTFQLD